MKALHKFMRWRMTPLGRELLEALEKDEWKISDDNEDWVHVKSGIMLWRLAHAIRVAPTNLDSITDSQRRRLLNTYDQLIIGKRMRKMLTEGTTDAQAYVLKNSQQVNDETASSEKPHHRNSAHHPQTSR